MRPWATTFRRPPDRGRVAGVEVMDLVSGGAMLLLAGLVILSGRRNAIHWMLGIHLLVRGFENVLQGINRLSDAPAVDVVGFWYAENGLEASIGLTALALAFAFWRPRSHRLTAIALVAAVAALVWGATPGFDIPPAQPDDDRDEWIDRQDGQVSIVMLLVDHIPRVAAGLLLASAALRAPDRGRRVAGAFLASGIIVYPALRITQSFVARGFLDLSAIGAGHQAGRAAILLAGAVGWGLLRRVGGESARPAYRAMTWLVVGATLVGVGTGLTYGILDERLPLDVAEALAVFLQPLLLAYAIFKFQIAELDVRVRWTLQKGTLVGIIVTLGFGLTQLAGAFIEDRTGSSVVGVVATGALLALVAPLRRVGDRVGRAALPEAKPLHRMVDDEKITLYREQLEFAWADGSIDRQERTRLERLRERLGIDGETALRIEGAVVAS